MNKGQVNPERTGSTPPATSPDHGPPQYRIRSEKGTVATTIGKMFHYPEINIAGEWRCLVKYDNGKVDIMAPGCGCGYRVKLYAERVITYHQKSCK